MTPTTGESGNPVHPTASVVDVADSRRDPAMKALYRMSRTAGVGLQDYAAVNVLAVVGLLLGLAGVLLVLVAGSAFALAVPLIAAVLSTVGLVQIRRSNGTETGQWIALGGLLLSLGIIGVSVTTYLRQRSTENAYKAELRQLVERFRGSTATTQASGDAYMLFDARFRETVKPETFTRTVQPRMTGFFGPGKSVTRADIGDLVVFETDPATGVIRATTLLVLFGEGTFPDGSALRYEEPVEFRRGLDGWKFYNIPGWFSAAKPAAPQ